MSREASDEERLRREGARIEALLGELSSMAGPETWPRIEELVTRTVSLYGAALARVIAHAKSAGARADLDEMLCADELVSSLLLLHGLHPRSTEERTRRALERVRPYLGSHGGGVELVAIEGRTARLRLSGSCEGCPSSRATVEHIVRQAIEEEAPEIEAIELARDEALVRIGDKARRARWEEVAGLDRVRRGEALVIAGVGVMVLRAGGALVAYRDRCRACGAALDPARLEGDVLACACGRRYEVARGGRSTDATAPHLEPLALLPLDTGAHRIALPEEA